MWCARCGSPAISMNKFRINFQTISTLYEARRKPFAISGILTKRRYTLDRSVKNSLAYTLGKASLEITQKKKEEEEKNTFLSAILIVKEYHDIKKRFRSLLKMLIARMERKIQYDIVNF